MKAFLYAAGLAAALMGTATAADAQYRGDHRDGRGLEHRGDRGGYGYDRGRHHGWDRNHRRCWTEWRHHHRVRICR